MKEFTVKITDKNDNVTSSKTFTVGHGKVRDRYIFGSITQGIILQKKNEVISSTFWTVGLLRGTRRRWSSMRPSRHTGGVKHTSSETNLSHAGGMASPLGATSSGRVTWLFGPTYTYMVWICCNITFIEIILQPGKRSDRCFYQYKNPPTQSVQKCSTCSRFARQAATNDVDGFPTDVWCFEPIL